MTTIGIEYAPVKIIKEDTVMNINIMDTAG